MERIRGSLFLFKSIAILFYSTVGVGSALTVDILQVRDLYSRQSFMNQSSWKCTDEDDNALLTDMGRGLRLSNPTSIGILYLAVGKSSQNEVRASIDCLRRSIVKGDIDINVTVVMGEKEDLGCGDFKQHGSLQQRQCWQQLMIFKIKLARLFPYDITLLIDTDVFWNPKSDFWSKPFAGLKARFMKNSRTDIYFTYDYMLTGVFRGINETAHFGWVNGGFLVYRRSKAVERFFSCTIKLMNDTETGLNEQGAYNIILSGSAPHPIRSLQVGILPDVWQCRGVPRNERRCYFRHSHFHIKKSTRCPLT